MKKDIGAESPYTRDGVTIIPLYRSRKTTFPGGAAGEKEPLGVLIHSGTSLSIVSFTGSYRWWEDLTDDYPGLRAIKPVFPNTTS